MRRFKRLLLLLAAVAAMLAPAAPPLQAALPPLAEPQAGPRIEPGAGGEPVPAMPPRTPALDKADIDAWLDGFVPLGLRTSDIAGAVVVVVKDGRVLTERGFGYADVAKRRPVDPVKTLFRPGSVSKLFTWTAVMQLVEQGKVDLDADVNRYLDFRIPPAFGRPITVRDLMVHRPGFEDSLKYLFTRQTQNIPSIGASLKRFVPDRVYPPGTVPAYSNYGAALAGYIVERVSGEPFERYVERHIFAPLDMRHSTFRQPLPPGLAADMAQGYERASGDPRPYEIIPMTPAGAMAASGDDMARFMIAHLDRGGPLLNPQTARRMHRTNDRPVPGLPGMALGFYHKDRNGLEIIGHGGDTDWFHSDMALLLDKQVGLFVSFNSLGREGAAHVLLERLSTGFVDRYFPRPQPSLPTLASAHEHGRAMAGTYISSRSAYSSWLRILGVLGPVEVTLNPDDTLTVPALTGPAGEPRRWREVAPWQWQDVGGTSRLGAVVRDGRVTAFAPGEYAPIFVFIRAPWNLDGSWMVPALLGALAIVLVAALAWPAGAIARRRYRAPAPFAGRRLWLSRATHATAWLMLAIAAGWFMVIQTLSGDISDLDLRLDGWIRALQVLELLAIAGTLAAVWNLSAIIRAPRRPMLPVGLSIAWAGLVALAMAYLVWLMITLNTLTPALDY